MIQRVRRILDPVTWSARILKKDPYEVMSAREIEVVRWASMGWSNAEVAEELGVSPRTIDKHLENVRTVLDLPNRVCLSRYAIRKGLV